MSETQTQTLSQIERLPNSRNGNPRFRFGFTDATSAVLSSDAAFGYEVENPGYRVGDRVEVTYTKSGRVAFMRALGPDETDAASYVGVAMRGTVNDFLRLEATANETDVPEDAELLQRQGVETDPADDPQTAGEEATERLYELPLCIERTTVFEIVLGVGGPDSRILIECDVVAFPPQITGGQEDPSPDYEIRRVLFRYSWEGTGEVVLSGEDREAAEAFARRVVPELSE